MQVESFAIVAILLAMSIIFLRTGKRAYAFGTIPLVFVPVMYILAGFFTNIPALIEMTTSNNIYIFSILIGLILACLAYGFFSSQIKKKSSKSAYLISCGGFSLLLSVMFIFDLLKNVK